jgi:hypothetical protein
MAVRGGHTGSKDKHSRHDPVLQWPGWGSRVTKNKGQANGLQAAAGRSRSTDFPVANQTAAAKRSITARIGTEGDSVLVS